jgi:ribose-phosphate pyrophosphokinase
MMKLLAGNGCPELASKIAYLRHGELTQTRLTKFSDGEIQFELVDHVRGDDAFIIQSTCRPANDNLMELAVIADALKRSATKRIIGVMPYYGYSRQDRRPGMLRTPITSRLVADLLETAGVDYVVTVDIHSQQQQGFFNVPFVNVSASIIFIDHIRKHNKLDNLTIVSPDTGGVARARELAKHLDDAPIAIIDKRRPAPNVAEIHHIIGNVEGRTCAIVDDLVDTAGTVSKASIALKKKGAERVLVYATHPVLSGKAISNIEASQIDSLIVTDTIPLAENTLRFQSETNRIEVISMATILSKTIYRIHANESISEMYR